MGSPITFGGFNQIDFSYILRAVMEQERAPIRSLEQQQKDVKERSSTFAQLATRLGAMKSAADALRRAESLTGRTASIADSTVATLTASGSSAVGTYDIAITSLARAQVSASAPLVGGRDTIVATGGTLRIGTLDVTVEGPVTLDGLAARINATDGIGVRASVVSQAAGSFTLVLTGTTTGAAHAFEITAALTGGPGVAFGAAPAVQASDAHLRVNNIDIVSSTNVIDSIIPGATLTLHRAGVDTVATITEDVSRAKTLLKDVAKAYNDLLKFLDDQSLGAVKGDAGSIGRDSLLRTLRSHLRTELLSESGTGAFRSLTDLGLEFDRSGRLSLNDGRFDERAGRDLAAAGRFLAGSPGAPGPFGRLGAVLDQYTRAGGVLTATRQRLDDQAKAIGARILQMEERLAVRRDALQREFMAADMAMTRMNSQMSSLSSIGGEFRLF